MVSAGAGKTVAGQLTQMLAWCIFIVDGDGGIDPLQRGGEQGTGSRLNQLADANKVARVCGSLAARLQLFAD